ncbi:arsenate reductase ArsC [Zavarzinia marina]|uniref:arsenate reductase ArsC n=1 Tax=Zavarzinia marina TaxID=2911065 RepID=UPI002E3510CA|nr:arsenate reductase ArsC [Zavarzinia marina]
MVGFGTDLPGAVLFCCTQNAIRSPMAMGLMRHFYGRVIFSDCVGVRAGELDHFAVAVMDEMGIDISRYRPKAFDDLEDTSFDLIVSLSPEAQHKAVDLTRTMACDVEYWPTFDPSLAQGSREQVLDAYREVRDQLLKRIRGRFGVVKAPTV